MLFRERRAANPPSRRLDILCRPRQAAKRHFCRIALGLAAGLLAFAAEFEDCQKLYLKGEYSECIRLATEAMRDRFTREDWSILLTQSHLELGHYAEARTVISNAMARYSRSIPVRLLAREVSLQNGQSAEAKEVLQEINEIAGSRRITYPDAASQVAMGRAALLLGADARLVLENFFNQAKKADPNFRETYLAIGQLALDKYDSDIASKTFQEALKKFPGDADMQFGLARAFANGDRAKMIENLELALESNPRHVPSLLLIADHFIDAEDYAEAEKNLEKVAAVNPWHADAWAYRAVLAHLRSDSAGETKARNTALKHWKSNPRVVHLIGQKLSQKYRFAEGAAYQREAVQWDPGYLPARIQLAQDLLRLGQDQEGWTLADDVSKKDGYDIVAYNLVTLRETLSKFQLLTNQDFVVRMDPRESRIYGKEVLQLLEDAKTALYRKYRFNRSKPTVVEIFPEQKDFAVRTFMMPGGEGYLGVCFGNVITANSPASQTANPSNWKAMLWHEFCHVVTLGITKNKMPRWLSEGISVFEEMQANRSWGQAMSPRYKEMIMKGELTPVGDLSAAFLTPKSSFHLQFAYYQSSLVVEYLVNEFGFEALLQILQDLSEGKPINQAIEARTAPMAKIESGFAAFARQRAEQLGAGLEWKRPEQLSAPPSNDASARRFGLGPPADDKWTDQYPKNYWALHYKASKLIGQKKWQEAKAPLQTLIENFPDQTGGDSAYLLLAAAHRGLGETNLEHQALSKAAVLDSDVIDAYMRLMELANASTEWSEAAANAQRYLAVNPLVPGPYRYLGLAQEGLGHRHEAIQAYETLLKLDAPDPAGVHFRLARLLHAEGDSSAKRHVLQSLEEAPRFLDAHRLLLAITQGGRAATNGVPNRSQDAPPTPKP